MSLVVNHRVVKQVALMYVSGAWLLISSELINELPEFSHVSINGSELSEVAQRLDDQVVAWRAEGHDVRCHRRRAEAVEAT